MIKKIIPLLFCCLFLGPLCFGQQILLDRPVQAGELVVFPRLKAENEFYYLPNQISLATHESGLPQFSFIKYVRNEKAVAGGVDQITNSGDGGGIVHAVVKLDVPQEMLREAQSELRRISPNGKIVGPIVFKGGTIALISSFHKANGETVQQVVGLGIAPILEGSKAAVSVQLTKSGADILWATFDTPTPDFSFSFEMEVEGYLSPKRVVIEANWDQIYKHETFEAALATPVLSAEIKKAMEDLKDSGAITVEQIGEDEGLEKLMETAYNKLTNLMFDKIAGSGVPNLSQLTGGSQTSMLERATTSLRENREETRAANRRNEERNRQLDAANARTAAENRSARRANRRNEEAGNRPQPAPMPADSTQQATADSTALTSPADSTATLNPTPSSVDTTGNSETPPANHVPNESLPAMAIAVSYQMKDVKRSGSFKIDLNKYTSDVRTFRFDENVGNVKKKCPSCFYKVNLDDPLYKQREIHARLDGLNFSDFGNYINSVEVLIRKVHENGEITLQGVNVDKRKFSEEANDFVMQYGWKGDDRREEWLQYEYRTKWSFFGGHNFSTDWNKKEEFGSINLTPPLLRKPVYIEASGDYLATQNIRAVEVNIYYTVDGKEQTQRVSIKPGDEGLSKTIYLVLPAERNDFEYQTTWFVKGQSPLQSKRIKSNYGMVFLDDLPLK